MIMTKMFGPIIGASLSEPYSRELVGKRIIVVCSGTVLSNIFNITELELTVKRGEAGLQKPLKREKYAKRYHLEQDRKWKDYNQL